MPPTWPHWPLPPMVVPAVVTPVVTLKLLLTQVLRATPVKSTASWQEPQAARVGRVWACAPWAAPLWQASQLRTSCG